MNQRPKLIQEVEAYVDGLIEGRKQGIAIQQSRTRNVEWLSLAILVFGCSLAADSLLFIVTHL